jgi:chemotaxis protein CheY-P-specific phosphatase CheC
MDRNYVFPLFVEAMNILVGKQISQDPTLSSFKTKLSPPKLSMIPKEVNTSLKSSMQKYDLELHGYSFSILTEYNIEALN